MTLESQVFTYIKFKTSVKVCHSKVEDSLLSNNMLIEFVLFIFISKWSNTRGYPIEGINDGLKFLDPPISTIQWHNRNAYFDIYENDRAEINPTVYFYFIDDAIPKDDAIEENKDSFDTFNVFDREIYKKENSRKMKSIKISVDPVLDDVPKLDFAGTLLEAVGNLKQTTTTQKPKRIIPYRRPIKKPSNVKTPNETDDVTIEPDEPIVSEVSTNKPITAAPSTSQTSSVRPQNNNLSGHGQIGNRESQMVIKPTVIVNIRGSVTSSDGEIKVEKRNVEPKLKNEELSRTGQNIFRINQEVNIDKHYPEIYDAIPTPLPNKNRPKKRILRDDKTESDDKIDEIGNGNVGISTEIAIRKGRQADIDKKRFVNRSQLSDLNNVLNTFQIGPLGGFISAN